MRAAFDAVRAGATEKPGPGHFLGVTVQPMVKLEGYEIILGSSIDPQFGPVLLFGSGGQLVEVYRDRARSQRTTLLMGGSIVAQNAGKNDRRLSCCMAGTTR